MENRGCVLRWAGAGWGGGGGGGALQPHLENKGCEPSGATLVALPKGAEATISVPVAEFPGVADLLQWGPGRVTTHQLLKGSLEGHLCRSTPPPPPLPGRALPTTWYSSPFPSQLHHLCWPCLPG